MKVKYSFSTGENTIFEVSEEWGELLLDLDRQEANNEKKEKRRHASLDAMTYEGEFFMDLRVDIEAAVENRETGTWLQAAIASLLPQQQALLKKVFFEERSIVSVAREEGVGESAIRDRLKRIEKKLKIFLE